MARSAREARRVLHPDGVFLVSTPNKLYYAESRADARSQSISRPRIRIRGIPRRATSEFSRPSLSSPEPRRGVRLLPARVTHAIDARLATRAGSPDRSALFPRGLCSTELLPELTAFLYVPRAANLLREREQHIHCSAMNWPRPNSGSTNSSSEPIRLLRTMTELTRISRAAEPLGARSRNRTGEPRSTASPSFRTNFKPSRPLPPRWRPATIARSPSSKRRIAQKTRGRSTLRPA